MKLKREGLKKLKRNIQKKNSILNYFLLSYIVVFLIPVFMNVMVYFQVIRVVRNETIEKNQVISNQLKSKVEPMLIQLEKIRTRINANNLYMATPIRDKDFSDSERYDYLQLVSRLNEFIVDNDFIESIYLYRNDTNLAMGTNGVFTAPELYRNYFSDTDLNYEQWIRLFREKNRIYSPYTTRTVNGIPEEDIMCVLPMETDISNSPWSHLVINIYQNRFASSIDGIENIHKNNIFILDKNNKVILLSGRKDSIDISYQMLTDEKKTLNMKVNGVNSIVSFCQSDTNDWKYVMTEVTSSYMERVEYLRNFLILCSLLSILIGIYFVYKFSMRNYTEIRSIADLFRPGEDDKVLESENELAYINKSIQKTLSQNQKINEMLTKISSETKDHFLIELLRGKKYVGYSDSEYADEVVLYFTKDNYLAAAINIESFEHIYFDKSELELKAKYNDAFFIISNVFNDFLYSYTTMIDGMMACIINEEADGGDDLERVETICNTVLETLRKDFNIWVTISLGNFHRGANAIKLSYDEAVAALNYKLLLGKNRLIRYYSIHDCGGTYTYTIENEQMLLNCAAIGAYAEAESIINDIFGRTFGTQTVSIEIAKCFVFDIANTVLKIIGQLDEEGKKILKIGENDVMNQIIHADTIEEMKKNTLEILKAICDYNALLIKDQTGILVSQVQNYINQNFKNQDLNVSDIANQFELTSAYISKLFKNTTSVSILDFIHTKRISCAKELLEQGKSIAETATEVGYNNSNAFIRVFKRYEKITPGQYSMKYKQTSEE